MTSLREVENRLSRITDNEEVSIRTGPYFCSGAGNDELLRKGKREYVGNTINFDIDNGRQEDDPEILSLESCRYINNGRCTHPAAVVYQCDRNDAGMENEKLTPSSTQRMVRQIRSNPRYR